MKDAQNSIDGGCEQREVYETMKKQNKKQKKHTQNQILKVLNCQAFKGERRSGEFDRECIKGNGILQSNIPNDCVYMNSRTGIGVIDNWKGIT